MKINIMTFMKNDTDYLKIQNIHEACKITRRSRQKQRKIFLCSYLISMHKQVIHQTKISSEPELEKKLKSKSNKV